MMTQGDDAVGAGTYRLVAESWDQLTSAPGQPDAYRRYVRGDEVALSEQEARRLWAAGAVAINGDSRPVDAWPTERRPDVVIYCDDGHPGDRRVVQRMRWMTEQDVWVGVIRRAAEQQITAEDLTTDDPRLDGWPLPARGRFPLRCPAPKCSLNVPVQAERLRFFLEGLQTRHLTEVSLRLLLLWLDRSPRRHAMQPGYGG
jgi:hypothetical protein